MPDACSLESERKVRLAMRYISRMSSSIWLWMSCAGSEGGAMKPGWNFDTSPSKQSALFVPSVRSLACVGGKREDGKCLVSQDLREPAAVIVDRDGCPRLRVQLRHGMDIAGVRVLRSEKDHRHPPESVFPPPAGFPSSSTHHEFSVKETVRRCSPDADDCPDISVKRMLRSRPFLSMLYSSTRSGETV